MLAAMILILCDQSRENVRAIKNPNAAAVSNATPGLFFTSFCTSATMAFTSLSRT